MDGIVPRSVPAFAWLPRDQDVRAAALPSIWAEHGFDVKKLEVSAALTDGVEFKFIACNGDLCLKKTHVVPYSGSAGSDSMATLPPPNLTPRLARALMLQPAALAALGAAAVA